MFGVHILVYQLLIITLYGIFIRTGDTTTSLTNIDSTIYFCLAFSALSIKHKMYDWSVVTNFIFVLCIVMQISPLYLYFWGYSFSGVFSATSTLNSYVVIVSIQCTLAVLVTINMFVGMLNHVQIFMIAMFQIFAFCLSFSINYYGVKMITGGGGITIFLFSLIFAIIIKRLRFHQVNHKQQSKYPSNTLRLIGLIVVIITWPSFNSITATPDLSLSRIASGSLLSEEAYIQTILCLVSSIATTLGLQIYSQKLNLQFFIRSVLVTGIFISSSASVIIDPFASLLMGLALPILYFAYQRLTQNLGIQEYAFDYLASAILSGIFSAIFTGGRNNRTPTLSTDIVLQGGLQFAGMLISALFAAIFGLITGLILRYINFFRQQTNNIDSSYWNIPQNIIPVYPDDQIVKEYQKNDEQQKLQIEKYYSSIKKPSYILSKMKQNTDLGKIVKQSVIADENR